MTYSVILTTTDSDDEARSLARGLAEAKLAACVQILPITSHYVWEEKLEESKELLLLIKTRSDLYDAVESFLSERHSYDTPEILELSINQGSKGYLEWMVTNTTAST